MLNDSSSWLRNPDISSRKEGRTIGVPQENASIHSNSSPSDKNQANSSYKASLSDLLASVRPMTPSNKAQKRPLIL